MLETMMASFVMALGISTSIIAMQQGYKFLDVARGTTLASQIIQSEIERIRMMSWTNVTAMASATDTTAPYPSGSPAGVEMFDGNTYFSSVSGLTGDYTITRTTTLDSTRSSDVALITVSVQWRTYDGRQQTRRFQMKYMKNGLYDYYYTLARP
jgi:Tfp pilus assembly protein PilV